MVQQLMDTSARQIQVSALVISMLDWAFSWLAVLSKSAIKLKWVWDLNVNSRPWMSVRVGLKKSCFLLARFVCELTMTSSTKNTCIVVPYPSTFLSRLFLDLMLVASFNNIKQVQSSKSHQFLTIIGIVRSFPQQIFWVSPQAED